MEAKISLESKIEAFNWDLKWFLSTLNTFYKDVKAKNDTTENLLLDILDVVDKIDVESKKLEPSGKTEHINLLSVDEEIFDFHRSIFCRICKRMFPSTRRHFIDHVAGDLHNDALNRYNNACSQLAEATSMHEGDLNNNKSVKSAIEQPKTSNDSAPIQKSQPTAALNESATEDTCSWRQRNNEIVPPMAVQLKSISSDVPKPLDLSFGEASARSNLSYNNGGPITEAQSLSFGMNNLTQVNAQKTGQVAFNGFGPKHAPSLQNVSLLSPTPFNVSKEKSPHSQGQPVSASGDADQKSWRQPLNVTSVGKQLEQLNLRTTSSPLVAPPPIGNHQSFTLNAEVSSGRFTKPSTAYELNSLYTKYPHLNPSKVPNPLEVSNKTIVPVQKISQATNGARNAAAKAQSPGTRHNNNNQNIVRPAAKANSVVGSSSSLNKMASKPNAARGPSKANNSRNSRDTFQKSFKETLSNLTMATEVQSRPSSASMVGLNSNSGASQNTLNGNRKSPAIGTRSNSMLSLASPHNATSKGAIPKRLGPKMDEDCAASLSAPIFRQKPSPKPSPSDEMANKEFLGGGLMAKLNDAIGMSGKIAEIESHSIVTRAIEELLKYKFKSVECHLMGSRINGTTNDDTAPLDIYLNLDNTFTVDKSTGTYLNMIGSIKNEMTQSDEWSDVKMPTQYGFAAKHNDTKMNCNFFFGTGVFARNNDLVKCFFDAQKVCRQLVLCIRISMENVNAPDWTKKFSGYIISLLVIFFFQHTKRLPSVKILQQSCRPKLCGQNHVGFDQPTNIAICKDRLSVLLTEFFEFYSKFDFVRNTVSPFEGCAISQEIYVTRDKLPDSVLRFKNLTRKEHTAWVSNMRMQDIFMHKRNVTQSIDLADTEKFQVYCAASLNVLRKAGDLLY